MGYFSNEMSFFFGCIFKQKNLNDHVYAFRQSAILKGQHEEHSMSILNKKLNYKRILGSTVHFSERYPQDDGKLNVKRCVTSYQFSLFRWYGEWRKKLDVVFVSPRKQWRQFLPNLYIFVGLVWIYFLIPSPNLHLNIYQWYAYHTPSYQCNIFV